MMNEQVKKLLISSDIDKDIRDRIIAKGFKMSRSFEMSREDFLDVYTTRLEISEGKHDRRSKGIEVKGLRSLVETFSKSDADSITIFGIDIDEDYKRVDIFTDSLFTILYGYIP